MDEYSHQEAKARGTLKNIRSGKWHKCYVFEQLNCVGKLQIYFYDITFWDIIISRKQSQKHIFWEIIVVLLNLLYISY